MVTKKDGILERKWMDGLRVGQFGSHLHDGYSRLLIWTKWVSGVSHLCSFPHTFDSLHNYIMTILRRSETIKKKIIWLYVVMYVSLMVLKPNA